MKLLIGQWSIDMYNHFLANPSIISNAVALLSRIHPQTKWLPRLLQPCYTGKTSSYAYQTL
uniref:Uncharacterized protein n=1 Tax=Amphimedon queenslandica TaxID=400682 RepID=A0A1X7V156_AMPQE